MMNSNQNKLKKCNEIIKSLREDLKKFTNKPNKDLHDISMVVTISSRINYHMGYRAALREVLGFAKENDEEVENEEQKKVLNIPLENS